MHDRERWNEKYRRGIRHNAPNVRLIMYRDRLTPGRALDLAGGCGENAAILALAGWKTVVLEISEEACLRARRRAGELRADLDVVQGDARHLPFRTAFDTVICAYFLDRSVDPLPLLRPGGTLFFETFTEAHARYAPAFPAEYRLRAGELRERFSSLEILHYAEEDDGTRAFATLLGRKRN